LLLGGDDAVIAMAAQEALPFLDKFKSVFLSEIGKSPKDQKLTVSAGLVWAHATYPIAAFVEKAEALLKSAKRQRKGFAVDYMVVTEAMTGDPERELAPTKRPYGWDELARLRDHVRTWKQQGVPSNKVRSLYPMAYEPKLQGELDFLFLKSRLSPDHLKLVREVIPETLFERNSMRTAAADVVELWDFVEA
jgi:hypothetical protein